MEALSITTLIFVITTMMLIYVNGKQRAEIKSLKKKLLKSEQLRKKMSSHYQNISLPEKVGSLSNQPKGKDVANKGGISTEHDISTPQRKQFMSFDPATRKPIDFSMRRAEDEESKY